MLRSYNRWIIATLSATLIGCGEPPEPVHRVGTGELPVLEVETARHADPEKFQLVQLKDGHDYWFYRDSGLDEGFAGLAHSPECKKCKDSDEQHVSEG